MVVTSADEAPERVRAALKEGALGYLPKTLRPKLMAGALRTILDGGIYIPPLSPQP